jgi:ADP-heptose:LPS heptosyltransferase
MSMAPVALCSSASWSLKRWPEPRFAVVVDWIIEQTGRSVLLFGADSDRSTEVVWASLSHAASSIVVRGWHLRRVAALLSQCAALVSNDTGLMHIAAAVGIPVVAIFGPTRPEIYLPRGASTAVEADANCQHRGRGLDSPGCWPSDHCLVALHSCTAAVQADAVITALEPALG